MQDAKDLPDVQEIHRLHLDPGDVLIVRFKEKLTHEMIDGITQKIQAVLAVPNKVIVFDRGAELEVIPAIIAEKRRTDADAIAKEIRGRQAEGPGL